MLVLCTGMYRSGSTWSYNVCRALMEAASPSVFCKYSENIQETLAGPAAKFDHVVLKCHAVDLIGRGLIKHASCWSVYTFRDPMDAIWSGMDAFKEKFPQALKNVKDSLEFLNFQSDADDAHFIWYNDITERPVERILMVADYLGVEPTPRLIKRLMEDLDREKVKEKVAKIARVKNEKGELVDDPNATDMYDKKTLFNRGHVRRKSTSGYDMLSDEQFEQALEALRHYVDDEGRLKPALVAVGAAPAEYAERAQAILAAAEQPPEPTSPPEPSTAEAEPTTERPALPPMRSKGEMAAELMRTLSPGTLASTGYMRRAKTNRWWTEI